MYVEYYYILSIYKKVTAKYIMELGTPKGAAPNTALSMVSPHTSSSTRLLKNRVLVEQASDLPEVQIENERQMARNRRHSRGLSNRALIEIQKTNVSEILGNIS